MSAPILAGRHATVIHRADRHRTALEVQLARIGLAVSCVEPDARMGGHTDLVLFDAELGQDDLFPWGDDPAPVPLVAIVGSEAPGRLQWALDRSATAFLQKPFGSSGAFAALVVACRLHEEIASLRARADELAERVRARPLVVRAVREMMARHGLDENASLSALRRIAMERRLGIESVCASIAAEPRLAIAWLSRTTQPSHSDRTARREPPRKDIA